MDRVVLIVVVGLLGYVRSRSTLSNSDTLTVSESVWVKDVTAKFQTQNRILGDPNLPDQLTFHIRRGSGTLTLKLKRNYEIDPNADIYFVQGNKDGRSILSKTTTLERDAVAYYQDSENGAYMTVRCINSLNQQCERIISGNIQIGDKSYDLRLARADDAAENFLEVRDSISRRYLLLDQTHLRQENLVENKDKVRQLKQNYYVKVAILIDSGVYDLYSSKVKYGHSSSQREEVQLRIREAFTHIMNGVNLRYKTIADPSISISVIPSAFIFFLNEEMFPHNRSKVTIENGRKYIEALPYLHDLYFWDDNIGVNIKPEVDHAMLFTTHNLYKGSSRSNRVEGISFMSGVCVPGIRTSVIQERHYVSTMLSAAHELGHNLGAYHDGEDEAASCKPEDYFIMSDLTSRIGKNMTYIKNMWTFSNCSVESFKKTLMNSECVRHKGLVFNKKEYTIFMKQQAGDVFTPQEQCSLIYGPGSVYFGIVSEDLCHVLRCKDPATGERKKIYVNAARGTKCGENKWCIEGMCVLKSST